MSDRTPVCDDPDPALSFPERPRRPLRWALTLVIATLLIGGPASNLTFAQSGSPGGTAIGGQLGEPAGISLYVGQDSGRALDLLAAFDLDDFFYLNAHLLYEEQVGDDPNLHVLYGPGAFLGVHDRATVSDEAGIGISGTAGLAYYVREFQIYARITPRFAVLPSTGADLGGGLGVRWFF